MEMTSKAFHAPENIKASEKLEQFCKDFWTDDQTINHIINRINDRSPHGERIRREKNPAIIYCIGTEVPQDQNSGKWLLCKVGLTQGDKNEPYNRIERVKNKIIKTDHDREPRSIFELPVSATDTSSIFSIEDRIRRNIGIRVAKKVIKEWHLPNKTEWVLTTKEYVSKKLQPLTTMKDASTDLFNNTDHMLIGNKKKDGDQEESKVDRIKRFCEDHPLPSHLQLDGCNVTTKIHDPLQDPQQQTSSESSAQQGFHLGCAQSVRAEQSLKPSSNMPGGSKTPRKSGKSPACSSKQAFRPSRRKDVPIAQSNAMKTIQSAAYCSSNTTIPDPHNPRAQGIATNTNSKRPTKETSHLGAHSIGADHTSTLSSTMSGGLKTQTKSSASSKQSIRPSSRKDAAVAQSNAMKRLIDGGKAASLEVDVSKDVQNLKPTARKKNSASRKSINSQTSELEAKRMKTTIQSEVYSSTPDFPNSRAQGIASNTNSKRPTETTSHAGAHSVRADQTTIHSSTLSGGLKLKTQTKKGKSSASSSKQPSRHSSSRGVPEAMVAQSNAMKRSCHGGEASSSEMDVSKDVQNLKPTARKKNSASCKSINSQTSEIQSKRMKTTIQSAEYYSTNTTIPGPPNSRAQGIASNTKSKRPAEKTSSSKQSSRHSSSRGVPEAMVAQLNAMKTLFHGGEASSSEVDVSKDLQNLKSPAKKMKTPIQSAACYSTNTTIPGPHNSRAQGIATCSNTNSKRPTEKTSHASVHSVKAEQTMTPSSTMSNGLKTQTERGKSPASSFKQPSSLSSTRGVPEAYHSSINTTIPDPHNSKAQQRIANNTNSGRPTEKTSQRPSTISSPHTRERKVSPEDFDIEFDFDLFDSLFNHNHKET